MGAAEARLLIVALAAVACAATLALALPAVLAGRPLLPDAVEYLGIAWSWVSGAGFVDPVLYSYYLPGVRPPVPALAMRAPALPALLAAPLAAGASLRAIGIGYTVCAALAGAAGVWLARRLGGLPAAAAYAAGFCLAYPWIVSIQLPITEALAVALLLALFACAPAALRSVPAAAGFAALLALAWLARPNLAVALPAVLLAAAATHGPRAALRSAPLWTAALGFVALQQAVTIACRAATGLAPYAHYGVLLETTSAGEAAFYQKQYVGWLAWVAAHGEQVRSALAWNARAVARLLFVQPDFHYVGWLAVPALADAWRRRDAQRFLRLAIAATGLALLAVTLAGWGAIDPRRLLVPAALCFWLLAAGWLAHAARRLPHATAAAVAPAALVLALWAFSPSAAGTARLAAHAVRAWSQGAVRSGLEDSFAPPLCAHLDRDALVASPHPWELYLACGNAGWVLPRDLDEPAWIERYLDEQAPGHLVVPAADAARFARSPRLERGAAARGHVVFTLRDAPPRSRPWRAPPPLASR